MFRVFRISRAAHDWQGLVEELEKGIAAATDERAEGRPAPAARAVLEDKFLQAVKALKHFQDAFKLNPQLGSRLCGRRAPSTGISARSTWSRSSSSWS
jgi:hypothetical protein